MKFHKKTALALSVASILVSSAGNAFAALNFGFADEDDAEPVLFASEQDAETAADFTNKTPVTLPTGNVALGNLSLQFPLITGYNVTDVQKMFLSVNLTGGAKFATEPQFSCAVSGFVGTNWSNPTADIALADAEPLFISANAIALNKSVVTYTLPADIVLDDNSGCILYASAYTLNGQDAGFSAVVQYTDAGQLTSVDRKGTFVSFVQAAEGEISTRNANGSAEYAGIIDVSKDSSEFDSTRTYNARTAFLGSVKYDLDATLGTVHFADTDTATVVSVDDIISSVTITINGSPLVGADTIYLTDGNGGFSQGCDLNSTIYTVSGNGSDSVVISGITTTDIVNGLNACMTVDGATFLEDGQISISLSGEAQDDWTPKFPAEEETILITKNGSSMVILNIPNSTLGDKVYLRFYNSQSRTANIRATLYGQDGSTLGGPIDLLALTPNSVDVLDVSEIETAFGVTAPWAGRAWMRVSADVDPENFRIQALVRNTNGTLINVSGQAIKD